MDYMKWCNNIVENGTAQKCIEGKIKLLVNAYFDKKDDYAIEKMIKSFCEVITLQEGNLLRARGLHSSQAQQNMIYIYTHQEETVKKFKEVENILISEIERQYRHFTTFLSAISTH